MRKIKKLVVVSCFLAVMQTMTGCDVEKEKESLSSIQEEWGFEIQVPDEMPLSICIEDGEVMDVDGLLEYFYGETRENLMAGGYIEEAWYEDCLTSFECNKDDIELSYVYSYNFENGDARNFFSLYDMREAAGASYVQMINYYHMSDEVSNRLKELYPETELDWCTREEVIAACAPLAKACGYEDAQVKVYAMTEEALKKYADDYFNDVSSYLNTPSSDYKCTGWKSSTKQNKWSKQYEAYLVVYNTMLNGMVLDSTKYDLCCVYAPTYGRVVYASGEQPLRFVSTLEHTMFMVQKDSLLQAIEAYLEDSSDTITITNVSMVYSPEYAKMGQYLERRTIDPCWRIDYKVSESMKYSLGYWSDDWTMMVNAIDGSIVKWGIG